MKYFFKLLLLISFSVNSQIKGKVTDKEGNPLPHVNIFVENTYNGTTTNEQGLYEFNSNKGNNPTLVFQYLGFQTQKHTITLLNQVYTLNVVLEETNFQLNELVLGNNEDPAYEVIRKAIASKKKNMEKTDKFEADFYSKGIFRVKDVPKKIFGQEIGDLDGNLDSTRSGVIYLSETVSKIKFERPNNLKEEIIASKISGNDKGFSYNTALNSDYNFYENYVELGLNMISPIADNASYYYKYQLESTFYDNQNQLINKILVTPKRDKEPVFEGYMYIVEDSWAIYGVDFNIKGYRMQQPVIETMKLVQNFSYNNTNQLWVKNVQSIDFIAGFLGINFSGKFTYVFSNYTFQNTFTQNTFGKEIVSFTENANKKNKSYWENNRKISLTEEEVIDYHKKDSIQTLRKSKVYLDSIDKTNNKFHVLDIFTGYTYKNSRQDWSIYYDGLSDFTSLNYNTVQGWNLNSSVGFRKYNEEKGKYTTLSSTFNYGFSDERLRIIGKFYHRFNSQNYAHLSVRGGSMASQFNNNEPIKKTVNTISTLFFKDNYIKLYNKEFLEGFYGQEVINGIFATGGFLYEKRKALFNTTDYVFIKNDKDYTSNNPIEPNNYTSSVFETHHIMKAYISTRIRFNQKYITRPDRKVTIPDSDYPEIRLNYITAFSATESNYKYDFVSTQIDYGKKLGNKGDFKIKLKGGKFFGANDIAFIDYKHFNGNQTHVNFQSDYTNHFNLLPYYTHSTNDAYVETHIEHAFNGFLLNKVPLLNKLQWNLVAGFHQINIPNIKPYQEFSIGLNNLLFGKLRFLRIDYVRAYQNGFIGDGFMFGLSF